MFSIQAGFWKTKIKPVKTEKARRRKPLYETLRPWSIQDLIHENKIQELQITLKISIGRQNKIHSMTRGPRP